VRERGHWRAGDLRDQVQLQREIGRQSTQGQYRGYTDVGKPVYANLDFRTGSSQVRDSSEVTEYGGTVVIRTGPILDTNPVLDIDGSWRIVVKTGPWKDRRFKVDGVAQTGWRREWTELEVSEVR